MRLDRQIHATSLEDRQDGDQPIQIALGHDSHHIFTAQPASQQRPSQPVSASVQLPVGEALPVMGVAAHSGDAVGMRPNPLLEELVRPHGRQLTPRPNQPFALEVELLSRQQALLSVFGIEISGDQLQRGEVIAGDPGCAVRIQHIGPIPKSQHQHVASLRDPQPQHGVFAEVAVRAGRVEDGLECRFRQAELAPELVQRKVGVR